jgi:hypothetical protein
VITSTKSASLPDSAAHRSANSSVSSAVGQVACNKRTVQKWESGAVTTPRGTYIRALEFALGEPIENLGFVPADEKYGLDRETAMTIEATRAPDPKNRRGTAHGNLAIPL